MQDICQEKIEKSQIVFYQPEDTQCQKISEVIGKDTIIFDIGCGSGYFLYSMYKNGHRGLLGTDIHLNRPAMLENDIPLDIVSKCFEFDVNDPIISHLIKRFKENKYSKKIAVFLVRPCHHYLLVNSTINMCKELGVDLYYIGLEKNISIDLFDVDYERIDIGTDSLEKEVMLKIKN